MALCIVVGFGTGVGFGIARAFGKAGYTLGLIARSPDKYADAVKSLTDAGVTCEIVAADASNEESLAGAIASLLQTLGTPEVLVYNVVSGSYGKPTALDAQQMTQDFKSNVVGALVAAKAVLPAMQAQSQGSILFTGGGWAHYPWDGAASISIGKAGIRSLAMTLSQELQDTPIRIGILSIMGQVAVGSAFDPEKIGEAFLAMHKQPVEGYEPEFMFKG
ncbi:MULTISPECIES: SDR family oxidoreductase [unclassified Microcoleus]|uniref:SDR family oxidoreductase n=1 Tax=unclassified Microcoleus TaxID=2642155 RepID=UPI002FD73790